MNAIVLIKHFINTIVWFLYQYKNEDFKNYLINNETSTRSIAILGNGPSLDKDLDRIKNINVDQFMVVNNFALSSLFFNLKPKYYIIVDPAYFFDEIFLKDDNEVWKKLMEVNWRLNLLIPFNNYVILQKKRHFIFQNKFIEITPLHIRSFNGFDLIKNILYKYNLSMPRVQNVVISSIFVSLNMNFKNIYILGVDHSWTKDIFVDYQNRVCITNKHFYNHEHESQPFYNIYGVQYKMHEILRDFAFMFEGYHELKKYSTKKNCNIINVTNNSFIDAFERF